MKKILCICLLFSISPLNALVINWIKVVGISHTREETILEIAKELKEGKEYTSSELKKIKDRIEERLKNTTWFYSGKVFTFPVKDNEEKVNIIIEVEEGFLWRFSGGNAYGGLGKANIWGEGEKIYGEIGYNRQRIIFEKLFAGTSLLLNTSIGNVNTKIYSNSVELDCQRVGFDIKTFYLFNWDFKAYLNGGYGVDFSSTYEKLHEDYYTGTGFLIDRRNDFFSSSKGYLIDIYYKWLDFSYSRGGIDIRKYFMIFQNVNLALRGQFILQDENSPFYYSLTTYGIDGIRRGQKIDGGNILLQFNTELRWKFFNTTLFSTFATSFELTTFFDTGRVYENLNSLSMENFNLAYGLGLRIYFDIPVYLPVRIEAGWDKEGKSGLFFEVSSPF